MLNLKPALVAVMLFTALFACKTRTGEVALRSSGEITVNGPQFDGSVHEGTKVLYTLKGIHEKQNYTLRTEIALKSDGSSTSSDGTLIVNIYSSADAFRNGQSPLKSADALPTPNSNIYEVNFDAESSDDYVVVISPGKPGSVPGIQFFYNLRLMSADPTANPPVLSSFTTVTIPASAEQLVNPLNPGYLNIYSGGSVTSEGTFTVSLVSNATTTVANPQMFVYLDSTLTISTLMLSSIPTSADFVVTRFNGGVPDSANAEHKDADVISSVTFTNGGPFIVLKGVVSAVTYTLSIGP